MTNRPSPIEAARQRHTLAEVARRTGIWLPSTTGTVTVRCPMPSHGHPDRTPSLRLYLDDGRWYCFACSDRAGDVIQWAQDTEGVDWRQAIDILDSGHPLTNAWTGLAPAASPTRTAAAGVQIEWPVLDRTPRERVQAVIDAAWDHCSTGPQHARGVAYLASRRINVVTLESYTRRAEVGHTPSSGRSLAQRLLRDDFTLDELVDAGLAHRYPDGTITSFYHHRVLIPIRDHNGQIAGLVGRNDGDPRWPKYKNPPTTILYNKSINIYQPLPPPTSPHGRVIVVEGTLDAMAIAVAAIKAGAAPYFCPITQSGRELSPRQIAATALLHPGPLVLAMDGDPAGRDSGRRIASAVVAGGRRAVLASLPDGQDPASVLARYGPRGLTLFTTGTIRTPRGQPTWQ
jgi:DNA primase